MLYVAPAKAPTAILQYSFDWSEWLSGAAIQSSAWQADDGLTVDSDTTVGPVTTVTLSGGAAGETYRVHNTVESDAGETDVRTVLIAVSPNAATGPGFQADMLLWRLTIASPPDSLPLPAYYESAIADSLAQLAQDVPLIRTATLNIVAGTASYSLPADFLFPIALAGMVQAGDGVLLTGAGIVPAPISFSERYEVAGGQITFYPTPTYTMSRELRYGAGYALVDGEYPRLTQNGARLALLYAQYLVGLEKANSVAGQGWKYQIGDEMVDKSNQGKSIMAQADGLLKQYQSAVKQLKGYGMRAEYGEVAAWA